MDGIERMKSFLRPLAFSNDPQIVFSPRLKGTLSEFGVDVSPITQKIAPYRWKTGNDGDIAGKTPQDRYNDAIKALTYWLYLRYGITNATIPKRRERRQARPSPW